MSIDSLRPTSSSSSNSTRESSITVAVRVRPFTPSEENKLIQNDSDPFFLGAGSFSTNGVPDTPSKKSLITPRGIRKIINVVDDKMLIFDPPETNPLISMQKNAFPNSKMTSRIREHRFVFDKLFDVSASQEDIYYNTTRPLLDSVLDGFNATVFAYGATGCGKTYTISGTQSDPGVIFLTMKELYQKIEVLSDTKLIDISLSFLEIYNETIRDLLNPETDFKKLILREDANNKISVANLSCHKPKTVEEVMNLIVLGNQNRTSSPTEANATSSRSHAVLQINVVQKNRTADLTESHTFATLSIIDLAGSERAAATKNRGARLNEGANINKSLLALGNCINALCDPRRRNHVPYRDSKLTRLLKFSLGGNCKTVMIVCVSPSSQHYDETLNTLKYANRAKEIKTKIIRNQHNLDRHVGSYLKMITEQKQEIAELRNRESEIVEMTINKQKLINDKCLNMLLDSIENIRKSLTKQNQEKWKKYFILAKRKLLLIQRIETETLLNGLTKIFRNNSDLKKISNIVNLSEQLISKIDSQITDLESQYSRPTDIDYIFNESTHQMLRKLKENEGWSDFDTLIFEQFIGSLKESLEREILFNSSILFDHLVHELKNFNFLPKDFVNILSAYFTMNKENIKNDIDSSAIVESVASSLELMVNGEYDTAIENYTSVFMQKKLKEQESQINNIKFNGFPNNLNKNSSKVLQKARESKRGPISPLKSSPPRNFKKSINKKPIIPKLSPIRLKHSKKVRWDVPNSETTFGESDISMDDYTSHNNTIIKSDVEEDSPLGSRTIDKSIIPDDLDLKFDPTLDSPPLSQIFKENMDNSIMSDMTNSKDASKSNPRFSSFTNRRLSINLSNQGNESLSSLPLLNKEASTKIIKSMPPTLPAFEIKTTTPSYIPSPSHSKLRLNSLGAPSRVINRYNIMNEAARNIESNGSEKVE